MRTDICAREDEATQTALLEALAAIGAASEDDSPLEVPFPTGLTRFRVGFEQLQPEQAVVIRRGSAAFDTQPIAEWIKRF